VPLDQNYRDKQYNEDPRLQIGKSRFSLGKRPILPFFPPERGSRALPRPRVRHSRGYFSEPPDRPRDRSRPPRSPTRMTLRRPSYRLASVLFLVPLGLACTAATQGKTTGDPGNGGLTLPAGFCAAVLADPAGDLRQLAARRAGNGRRRARPPRSCRRRVSRGVTRPVLPAPARPPPRGARSRPAGWPPAVPAPSPGGTAAGSRDPSARAP
jgi:hypothetical protein